MAAGAGSALATESGRGSRGGAVLIAALVVDSIGNGLFLPLGLIFFTRVTEVPLAAIGVILSAANVLQLPVPVLAGWIADRIGALPLVIAAQLLQAAGYGVASIVTGPVGIAFAALLTALGVRIFWSTVFTAIADYVDGRPGARSKDHWYGWANIARTGGLGVGGLLTGIAMTSDSTGADTYRSIAVAAAVCFALAAVAIALFVRAPRATAEEEGPQIGYRELIRDRPYLGLILVNACYALSAMMLPLALPTLVLDVLDAPAWLVSTLLVANTLLVAAVTAPIVNRLTPYRRTRILVTAALLWAGWAVFFATLRPGHLDWAIPVLVGATLLYSAATIVHAPTSAALAASAAPLAARGRYLASFQYSFTLAEIAAPAFFTTLLAFRLEAPWLALAALNALSALALLRLERRLPRSALRD